MTITNRQRNSANLEIAKSFLLLIFLGGIASGVFVYHFLLPKDVGQNGISQQESLVLTNEHVWFNQSGWAEAAIVIVNTGGIDAVINRIVVREIECKWQDVYYWKTDTGPLSNDLEQTSNELSGSAYIINIGGTQRVFQRCTGMQTLPSGWTIVFYMKNPGNLTSENLEEPVVVSVFTEDRLYYKETTIDWDGEFTFMQTEQVSITAMTYSGTTNDTSNDILLTVKNTGSSKLTLSSVTLNGETHSDVTIIPTGGELEPGATGTVTLNDVQWVSGNTYRVILQSCTGTNVASYEKRAS